MKQVVFALLIVGSVAFGRSPVMPFPPTPVAERWETVGVDFMVVSGTQGSVPIPARAEYVPGLGYTVRPPYITHFIVRVGPGSQRRGCAPITSDGGAIAFTGVLSTQPFLEPTQLVGTEYSTAKRGWLNYEFNVNGGMGAPVQGINVAFQRTQIPTQCFYELLWKNDTTGVGIPRSGTRPGEAARAAAPVANEDNKEHLEFSIKTGDASQY